MADLAIWSLVAGVVGLIVTIAVSTWSIRGKLINLYNATTSIEDSVDDIDGDLNQIDNEMDEISSSVVDISQVTDDLYKGVIKILEDRGVDFIEIVSNSVKYPLDNSEVNAIISFDKKDEDEGTTHVTIRFSDSIYTELVQENIDNDKELAAKEQDLFENDITGTPGEVKVLHRGEQVLNIIIPSLDDEPIAIWIKMLLDRIDMYHAEYSGQKQSFEESLMNEFDDAEITHD